ncbi:MAG: DUF2461 domain-containing protein [Dehalococcoidia bacterium]|nr:DUF2461 domain-containing protein [Dehalococcoidia bacterium]
MSSGKEFSGFPEGTFGFLRDISENNSREWFETHRREYEQYYLEPALDFIMELGPRLQEISSSVKFEPRVNGSLFRIHRDVRFSRDKTPYKNHLDIRFWEGERRGGKSPGFFFRMHHDQLMLGSGTHGFQKGQLEAYRQAVLDRDKGEGLVAVLENVRRAGPYEIGGATRKAVPRGFDPRHERADLLLHEGLWAGLEGEIPSEARSTDFIDYCIGHFSALQPINRWLLSALSAADQSPAAS